MQQSYRMYRCFGLGIAIFVALCISSVMAQTPSTEASQSEFARLYDEIIAIRESGAEVPSDLYDRYFELQKKLTPIWDSRGSDRPLDEGMDGCPGLLIIQPQPGTPMNYFDAGQTNTRRNDCTFPRCRQGRDVMYKLELNHPEWLEISTCGSEFDTYLCIYRDSCCADTASRIAFNQDAPQICGPRALQAAISRCFLLSGTYFITLDGANTGAYGYYQFRVRSITDSSCFPPEPPDSCTAGYFTHVEAEFPNDGVCEASIQVNCEEGYCGIIDRLGDRDVYRFIVPNYYPVVLSLYADDTPNRSGYRQGLDPMLRLFEGPACDHPLYTNDNVNTEYPDISGNDARITTMLLRPGTYWLEVTGNNSVGPYEFFIHCISEPTR